MNDSPYEVRVTEDGGALRRPLSCFAVALGGVGIVVLLVVFLMPFQRSAGPAAWKTKHRNQLKQICLALECYRDVHAGELPPVLTVDEQGQPLHSWRTLILPYLGHQELYDQIDLSLPWNHPKNRAVAGSMESYCSDYSGVAEGMTRYHAVWNADIRWFEKRAEDDRPEKSILLAEVDPERAVHWMRPEDTAAEFLSDPDSFSELLDGEVQAVCRDGRVISCEADELIGRPVRPEEID